MGWVTLFPKIKHSGTLWSLSVVHTALRNCTFVCENKTGNLSVTLLS